MKRIAVFQDNLNVGGIQKSLINLLRNIDYDSYEVDLYLSEKGGFWSAAFPERLNVIYPKTPPRILSFLPFDMAKSLFRFDFPEGAEYDLAIDFNSYQFFTAMGALSAKAEYRVMWIHNDVRIKLSNEWKYRVLWFFFKGKFKYYDEFVPVSDALAEPFRRMSGMENARFRTVQNYIDVSEIHEKMQEEPEGLELDKSCMNFVALGRLCHQKGYDIMLDAFNKAAQKREDLRLYIIGDGVDRAALERQRDELGLADKVFFLGNKPNPYCYMARMDAFVSTSRYEGQPLNIMEAMAVGLPLYCSKNLEKYTEGLEGYEDIPAALALAQKQPLRPDELREYNAAISRAIAKLANAGG